MNKQWYLFLPVASLWLCVVFGQEPQQIDMVATQPTNQLATVALGPRISFGETVHDFGKVCSGSVVKHEFVFTNVGDATLEVTDVHTSCGCTTAGEWSRQIEPGQTGRIPVQFNTGGFAGTVMKTVTVTSNDRQQPRVVLQLKATVWRPVEVSPPYAVIYANAETLAEGKAIVRIICNEETPLEISKPDSNSEYFVAELRTVQPGKEFEVQIKPVPEQNPVNRQGVITLRTSSTNVPQIEIRAMTILQPVVMVSPPQINLPPGPLDTPISITLTVRNFGTNVLTISEPAATTPEVGLDIKELEPGRVFNVIVHFPAGFQVQPGKSTEISFRSNHPLYPRFNVPVMQVYRPPVAQLVPSHAAGTNVSKPLVPPPVR